jgi:hypothetical protein
MIFWGSSGTIIPTPNMNKNTDRFNPMMDIRFSIIIPPVMDALRDCPEKMLHNCTVPVSS